MAPDLLATVRTEIDARRRELRAAFDEYEQLLSAFTTLEAEAGQAAESDGAKPAARRTPAAKRAPAPKRASAARKAPAAKKKAPPSARDATQQAILAALEHGSHTVAELAVVTAISGSGIRDGLRGLAKTGAVSRAERDGKAAYALRG